MAGVCFLTRKSTNEVEELCAEDELGEEDSVASAGPADRGGSRAVTPAAES
jgi:hypothetical protein